MEMSRRTDKERLTLVVLAMVYLVGSAMLVVAYREVLAPSASATAPEDTAPGVAEGGAIVVPATGGGGVDVVPGVDPAVRSVTTTTVDPGAVGAAPRTAGTPPQGAADAREGQGSPVQRGEGADASTTVRRSEASATSDGASSSGSTSNEGSGSSSSYPAADKEG